jgi:hypothetical protein
MDSDSYRFSRPGRENSDGGVVMKILIEWELPHLCVFSSVFLGTAGPLAISRAALSHLGRNVCGTLLLDLSVLYVVVEGGS